MAICPQCQFSNPSGVGVCLQCGQHCGFEQLSEELKSSTDVSECTPTPEGVDPVPLSSELTGGGDFAVFQLSHEDPSTGTPKPPATQGTDISMPSLGQPVILGQAPPSALTIRNRINAPSKSNLSPVTEGPAAVSVLESGVTKFSPKVDRRDRNVCGPATPIPERNSVSPIADAILPVKPVEAESKPIIPRLIVLRGEKLKAVFPIYPGKNIIGRFAEKPVDIDLEGQETIERIRISRHHATIHFDKNELRIEDLNSLNGTWVNGVKIHPGQLRRLASNDVIQVGTVQLKLEIEQAT